MQNKDMHFSSSCEGALGGRGQVLVLPPPPPPMIFVKGLLGGGVVYIGAKFRFFIRPSRLITFLHEGLTICEARFLLHVPYY